MLETNFYSSQYTRVLKDSTTRISGPAGLTDGDKRTLAMRRVESRALALSYLLGGKPARNQVHAWKPSQKNEMVGLYNNYSASGKYLYVKHEHAEMTVDNSGPCTTNSSLDKSMSVACYIKRAQESNEEVIRNAGNAFTSHNSEAMVSVSEAYRLALNDKYTYLRDEALKHTDPKQYIYDKYNNPESPFFASDLTASQRKIAYWNEKEMLKNGYLSGVHFQDSLFGDTYLFGAAKDADERIFNRRMINQQLSNMLKSAGVEIPANANFKCTVDVFSCRISISDQTGDNVDRSDLIRKMEEAINVGNNGVELYTHIRNSCYSMYRIESSQYEEEGWYKFNYLHNIEESSKGMDGDYNDKFAKWCEKYYPGSLAEKAKEVGFDGFRTMNLEIGLNAKGFYDLYQDINWTEPQSSKVSEWYSKTEFSVLGDMTNTVYYSRNSEKE